MSTRKPWMVIGIVVAAAVATVYVVKVKQSADLTNVITKSTEKIKQDIQDLPKVSFKKDDDNRIWNDRLFRMEKDSLATPKTVDEKYFKIMEDPKKNNYTNYTLNTNLQPLALEQAMTAYIQQLQVNCKGRFRFGNKDDGGWDICLDGVYALKRPCVIYSMGIAGDWTFDDHITKSLGCELHAFDPSINQRSHRRSENIFFHDIGISGSDYFDKKSKWTMRKMSTIRELLGHTQRPIDYVKMDIERSEWSAIPAAVKDGFLKHVKQFAFELHVGQDLSPGSSRSIYNILHSLEANGFRKYHYNENYHCRYRSRQTGKTYTQCHEIYYLNTNFMQKR